MPNWTVESRREAAVLGRLYDAVQVRRDEPDARVHQVTQAIRIVEAAWICLRLIVSTAATDMDGKEVGGKSVWRPMTAETGLRAATYVAHGLSATSAAVSAPHSHLDPARQDAARALLRSCLPWPAEEEASVADTVRTIDRESAVGLDPARIGIARNALGLVAGAEAVASLPGFRAWDDDDPTLNAAALAAWQICFSHAMTTYLHVTDPDGLAAASSRPA